MQTGDTARERVGGRRKCFDHSLRSCGRVLSLMELAACSRLTSTGLDGEFEIVKHWLIRSYANFSTWQLFLDLTPHYSHSKFSSNLPTLKGERPRSATRVHRGLRQR